MPLRAKSKRSAKPGGRIDLGLLPEWNLADLYPALDAPQVKSDLEWAESECVAPQWPNSLPRRVECPSRVRSPGALSGHVHGRHRYRNSGPIPWLGGGRCHGRDGGRN